MLIENPHIGRTLPDVLDVEEIDAMIAALPAEKDETPRNRAILEMLYGSGLRVSELVSLRISMMQREEQCVIIEGKGAKQRLVPVSDAALEAIDSYLPQRDPKPGNEDYLFLNRRGRQLTRQMVFFIVKGAAEMAVITNVFDPSARRGSQSARHPAIAGPRIDSHHRDLSPHRQHAPARPASERPPTLPSPIILIF